MAQGLVVTVLGGVIVAIIVAKFGIAPKHQVVVTHAYGRPSGGRVWKWVMTLGVVIIFAGLVYAGTQASGAGINQGMYAGYGMSFFGLLIWAGGKFARWIAR